MAEPTLLEQIEHDVLTSQPLADTLRKCVLLGGKAGSIELREWATRELRGYDSKDDAPNYRTVGALILADAITGNMIVTGQQIGVSSLPDFVREKISNQFTLLQGIGQLEAMAASADSSEDGALKLSLPGASEIGSLMDQKSGDPFQQITALYWSISGVAIHGVLDQVRTTLAELVAEMRAVTPSSSAMPTAGAVDRAVNVAIHGERAQVTVQSAQASEGSLANLRVDDDHDDSPFWTTSRQTVAFLAGLVSIGYVVAEVLGWI